MLIVESQSLDVYRNLAIEEYLMDHADGPVLFLWRSECAVVLGKNQNPWRECRLDLMRIDGVPLARRISGGGTVYHDAGNLNYCVCVERTGYREQQAYDMVIHALTALGVDARRTGKSNLSVEGLKFSGNAFCFRKGRAMHHGTLLLRTDLERLQRYLGSMFTGIETHAIASVPALVTNLQLGMQEVSRMLKESFAAHYNGRDMKLWTDGDLDARALEPLIHHQHASVWQFGATPRFTMTHADGELDVVRDRIVEARGSFATQGLVDKTFSDIAFSLIC